MLLDIYKNDYFVQYYCNFMCAEIQTGWCGNTRAVKLTILHLQRLDNRELAFVLEQIMKTVAIEINNTLSIAHIPERKWQTHSRSGRSSKFGHLVTISYRRGTFTCFKGKTKLKKSKRIINNEIQTGWCGNTRAVKPTILHLQRLDNRELAFVTKQIMKTIAIEINNTLSDGTHFTAPNNDCGVREYDKVGFQLVNHFHFSWPQMFRPGQNFTGFSQNMQSLSYAYSFKAV
ncbi:hypothetical protein M8C21_006062 [Ambrosia artemisiifolia]|uniref:Uncharacterized protein n=1 Tax=Ambrosia artemisiifolia TaxID=4212 RepID=A0AAD5BR93_AMBAR|nr:hypothetical protein M8C21_006062 [Ambrosia artemisiifolia]